MLRPAEGKATEMSYSVGLQLVILGYPDNRRQWPQPSARIAVKGEKKCWVVGSNAPLAIRTLLERCDRRSILIDFAPVLNISRAK
jgi:hypothetical protein